MRDYAKEFWLASFCQHESLSAGAPHPESRVDIGSAGGRRIGELAFFAAFICV